jgi:hypothetical protein
MRSCARIHARPAEIPYAVNWTDRQCVLGKRSSGCHQAAEPMAVLVHLNLGFVEPGRSGGTAGGVIAAAAARAGHAAPIPNRSAGVAFKGRRGGGRPVTSGRHDPGAPLCGDWARYARNGTVTLGWCEAGRHHGRPLHTCPCHRIQFVALNVADVRSRRWNA